MTETTPSNIAPPARPGMSRRRAALLHFLISVAVFSAVIIPLLFYWFPPPLFFADGGWEVIQIAAGVDIVVGPLLTLVVFKSGKKGLKFDLAMIAIMQVAALAWGVHIMYRQRPVFMAFAEDRFSTVTLGQVGASTRPREELLGLGNDIPIRVLVRLPDDPKEAMAIKMAQVQRGASVFRLADRYEPMTQKNLEYVYSQAMDMDAFLKSARQYRDTYDSFLQKNKLDPRELAFIPLMCRYESVIIALRRSDSSIAGTLFIPPPDYNLFAKSRKDAKKTDTPGDKK